MQPDIRLGVIWSSLSEFRHGPPNGLVLVEETELYSATEHFGKRVDRGKLAINVYNASRVEPCHVCFDVSEDPFKC